MVFQIWHLFPASQHIIENCAFSLWSTYRSFYPFHLFYIIHSYTCSYLFRSQSACLSVYIKGQGCSRRKIHNIVFNVLVFTTVYSISSSFYLSLPFHWCRAYYCSHLIQFARVKGGWEKQLNSIHAHHRRFCGQEMVVCQLHSILHIYLQPIEI